MANPHDTKRPIELHLEELEERIAPGGLTIAAAASGQAVPPAAAATGLATAAAASGMPVPPAAAQ